jgi:hypothetical protein
VNDEELQHALSELPRERTPPVRRVRPRGTQPYLRIAAAVALVVIGAIAGRASARFEPTHVILIQDDAAGGDEQARIREYGAWARDLRIRGERLDDTRETLRSGAAVRSSAARAHAIGGFFLIDAGSEADAERIARSCPHIRHGGSVELRRIAR